MSIKEAKRRSITVKDKPLFSAVRKAYVANTVTTPKIKRERGRERDRVSKRKKHQ